MQTFTLSGITMLLSGLAKFVRSSKNLRTTVIFKLHQTSANVDVSINCSCIVVKGPDPGSNISIDIPVSQISYQASHDMLFWLASTLQDILGTHPELAKASIYFEPAEQQGPAQQYPVIGTELVSAYNLNEVVNQLTIKLSGQITQKPRYHTFPYN